MTPDLDVCVFQISSSQREHLSACPEPEPALCINSCGQGAVPVALLCIRIVPGEGNGCDSGDLGEVSIVSE